MTRDSIKRLVSVSSRRTYRYLDNRFNEREGKTFVISNGPGPFDRGCVIRFVVPLYRAFEDNFAFFDPPVRGKEISCLVNGRIFFRTFASADLEVRTSFASFLPISFAA